MNAGQIQAIETRLRRLEDSLRKVLTSPQQREAFDSLFGSAVNNAILVAENLGSGRTSFAWKELAGSSGMSFAQSATAMTGSAVPGEIDHTALLNIGTTSHADIDTALATAAAHFAAANPHSGSASTDHDAEHVTGGSDKIRDATAALDGLMTAAFASKLDGIEAGAVAEASISHLNIQDIGSNSHATIDTHLGAANPHSGSVGDADYDAKGKILVGTGAGTFAALTVGSDTQVLTADSGEASGVKWAAAGGGDITGPVSSTDNAIARWDGTGGDTLQDTSALGVNDNGDLIDANANELLEFSHVSSAVNHVQIQNAATGNGAQIAATGDDTDIDLTIQSQGAGTATLKSGDTTGETIIGDPGDIELGDSTLRTMFPNTDEKIDLGNSTHRFNELHVVTITPKTKPTYTPSNVTTDRTYDADSTSTAELADVLGTLIADLQSLGVLA